MHDRVQNSETTQDAEAGTVTDQAGPTVAPVLASSDGAAPKPQVSDVSTGTPVQDNSNSVVRVEANQIGIGADVFERAIELNPFCRMTYPGGKDLETLFEHGHNRETFATDDEPTVNLDRQRLQAELDTRNKGKPAAKQMKADIFRATKLQGVVYHSDEEIIVSFEGSDALEGRHYLRNLIKSPIILQPKMFFHDLWRTGKADEYEDKIQKLAERIAEPSDLNDPKKMGEIVGNLRNAKVHKGWWDALNLPLLFGPDAREGDTIWSAVERQVQELEAEIERRTGKKPKLTFTGHSSGGALSMIAAARWMENNDHLVDEIYTFGQPRTGTLEFRNSIYEFMDRNGKLPIYRFEMEGDPVPSLPFLASFRNDHLRHIGNSIGIAPNGGLLGIRYQGRLVTAEDAARSIDESMTLYYRTRNRFRNPLDHFLKVGANVGSDIGAELGALAKLVLFDGTDHKRYVTVPDDELGIMFKRRGINRKYKDDPGLSNLPGTLFDLASHLLGISAYRHALPTMQEALTRQLRMEQLREVQGGCLKPLALAEQVSALSDTLHAAHQAGKLDFIPEVATLLATLDVDKAALMKAAIEDKATPAAKPGTIPKLSNELKRAAVHLGNARSDDPYEKLHQLPEQASLVGVVKALKPLAHSETAEEKKLYTSAKDVLDQVEYFITRRVPMKVDKHAVKVLKDNRVNGNGNGNGHAIG